MSPEQARAERVDRRADIFSVGVMLWECLAGQRMWRGREDHEILRLLSAGQVPRLEQIRPDAPAELAAICARALAPCADERYQTAAEFQAAIDSYLDSTVGRVAASELGAFLMAHFSEERARIRACVESQLASAARGGSPADSLPDLGAGECRCEAPPPAGESLPPTAVVPSQAPRATSTPHFASAGPLPASSPRRPSRPIALIASLFLLVAVGVVLLVAYAPRARSTGPAALSVAQPSPPRLAEVSLRADPPEAVLFVDGTRLDTNPGSRWVPVDGRTHWVEAEAPGFDTRRQTIDVQGNTTVVLQLDRAGAVGSASADALAPSPSVRQDAPPTPGSKLETDAGARGRSRQIDSRDPWTK